MERLKFKGLGVALVTPFNEDKTIDFDSLKKLIDYNIENGVDFLVALGTTAESATLNLKEKQEVVEFIKKVNNKRKPIVLGIGGNNTEAVIASYKDYNLDGIDAILSVTPYYNKPTQEGMYQHFKTIVEKTELPIILYNVPGRTGVHMSVETTLRLANEFEQIVAIKEASANLEHDSQIIAHRPEGFMVFSGDDSTTLGLIAMGGEGVISVIGQGMPKEFSELVHFALEDNFKEAQKRQNRLIDLMGLIFKEGNPAGIKALLRLKSVIKDEVRLPLVKASEILNNELKKHL